MARASLRFSIPQVKGGKYQNVFTVVDGIRFDSKAEGQRYQELCLLGKAGKIRSLVLQPWYRLTIKGNLICTYIADFQYFDIEKERWVVEDVKGMRTSDYVIKKKLMYAIHGIEIVEIRSGRLTGGKRAGKRKVP